MRCWHINARHLCVCVHACVRARVLAPCISYLHIRMSVFEFVTGCVVSMMLNYDLLYESFWLFLFIFNRVVCWIVLLRFFRSHVAVFTHKAEPKQKKLWFNLLWYDKGKMNGIASIAETNWAIQKCCFRRCVFFYSNAICHLLIFSSHFAFISHIFAVFQRLHKYSQI